MGARGMFLLIKRWKVIKKRFPIFIFRYNFIVSLK